MTIVFPIPPIFMELFSFLFRHISSPIFLSHFHFPDISIPMPSHLDLGVTWVCVYDLTWHQNDLKVD